MPDHDDAGTPPPNYAAASWPRPNEDLARAQHALETAEDHAADMAGGPTAARAWCDIAQGWIALAAERRAARRYYWTP